MKREMFIGFKYIFFALFFLIYSCTREVKQKFIVSNNYKGFFAVIYKDDKRIERKMKDGFQIYEITESDVYQSGFETPQGATIQEFYYRDNSRIDDVGLTNFSRLNLLINKDKLQFLKDNSSKNFVIYFYGGTDPDPDKSEGFSVFLIAEGAVIVNLLSKREEIFRHLTQGYDFLWQINEDKLKKDILKLNEKYSNKEYPFN